MRLSKDGGATFPFVVSAATGHIGPGVTPGTDRRILWQIAAEFPGEQIPNAVVRVVAEDGYPVMLDVPEATFLMGRRNDGDDEAHGQDDELPQHSVSVDAYRIGKYEVTNSEYATVLNWALGQSLLKNMDGTDFTGADDVYAYGRRLLLLSASFCQITFQDGVFGTKTRDSRSMDDFPAIALSWYGAAAFCNWLSEIEGLTPCYDTTTWARISPLPNGYRLPTEAEWERAAAYQVGATDNRFIYGVSADGISHARANYAIDWGVFSNPAGLTSNPRLAPVGMFDGVNTYDAVDPMTTQDSPSPVGAYDMSGNVIEWVSDWYDVNYYNTSPAVNPTGPVGGTDKILRGGGWTQPFYYQRTAIRVHTVPNTLAQEVGFRLARTP